MVKKEDAGEDRGSFSQYEVADGEFGTAEAKCSSSTITKRLLATLSDESNPITHSDIRLRSDHIVSFASGHQVAEERVNQRFYIAARERMLSVQREASSSSGGPSVFKGVKIYIDGYLEATTDIEIKRLVSDGGGQVVQVQVLCPDYSPNSHELSRLTYYASNHPGKLAKIGSELENRLKLECKKAKAGNIRSRASLLISVAIFRSLATECRRDIALLSPSLIGSVDFTLASVPSDLEVVARTASVFTAWTTYTNGHLIGADSHMTKDYLSILSRFANLSCISLPDQETQNRTRLIGLAALTAALNSEALYNDVGHFGAQVSTILHPILINLFETPISTLEEQSTGIKDAPISPYLAEFRTRPALERRAASIHIHIDGDKGPSNQDVSDACLRALFSLLSHANGAQLGYIMQSSFDNFDSMKGWTKLESCCWFAQKTAEWAQYQYRYVVPTWIVERLLAQPDASDASPLLRALTAMATSVFSSPTPLINLSSSDIMSNILTLLLRRITLNPQDAAVHSLVECISSLGHHVYYSDQIQDLAAELISRLVVLEMQGVLARDQSQMSQCRSLAIQCLFQGLVGLVRSANINDYIDSVDDSTTSTGQESAKKCRASLEASRKNKSAEDRIPRRTRVPPDIWQDTLSLLCDSEPPIRKECAVALVYYIMQEMPKHGESSDPDSLTHLRRLAESSFRHVQHIFPYAGDPATKFLNSVHAYVYILATSPTLGLNSAGGPKQPPRKDSPNGEVGSVASHSEQTHEGNLPSSQSNRRSFNIQHGSRARKQSLVLKLIEKAPTQCTISAEASEEDYAYLLKILTIVQTNLPLHGLITGVPMLSALDAASKPEGVDADLLQRIVTIKTVIAHVYLTIGQIWKVQELVGLTEKAIASLSSFPNGNTTSDASPLGLNVDEAVSMLVYSRTIQDAFGMEQEGLLRRLKVQWTPELAFRDFESSAGYETSFRGDGVSPLLKISPALMHIENISLQSLARSTRGLGVTDLREALEGRSSMSNPALVRPPSLSTLDHTSSFMGGDGALRLTQTRSRTRAKKRSTPSGGEVRDVLSRLGISKQNSSLLKATFPALQKSS
ncbi:unnamed protein product [Cyclocybe aegerita]|uniref:BRCT domain-containing protein n=1 Tax=Cyclocybe aegerita TaxID=1973307 RepID=A0A8S0W2M0_CYCAE|nr:unnamed protein product [Cyclocybe aegerita]